MSLTLSRIAAPNRIEAVEGPVGVPSWQPAPEIVPLSTPALRLRLIGRMQATGPHGVDLLPRVRKTRALLAILALSAPHPVLRDDICGLLWSSRAREQARGSLRQAAHELQEKLVPLGRSLIESQRSYLALTVPGLQVDLLDAMRPGGSGSAPDLVPAEVLEDLVGLDPAFDRWQGEQRRRLKDSALALARTLLATADGPDEAIGAAERLLQLDRSQEDAWRALIEAHDRRGERGAAVRAAELCSAALAETGRGQPSDETVALLARVRQPAPAPAAVRQAAPAGERGTRLGVMPLRSLDGAGGDPLSFGLAEEITTALSRFREFFLIASSSLATLADAPRAPGNALDALGLDYLFDGTVQRAGGRVRVTVRLLDMRADRQVAWSQRFDSTDADLLSLQDRIAQEVVAQVDPALLTRFQRPAAPLPQDPSAYELLLRAIPGIYRVERAALDAAGTLLEEAVRRDPDYAAAHAWWAYLHVLLVGQGWADDPGEAMRRGGKLAERAVLLDPNDARALALAGHARAFLHKRVDDAVRLHDRALSLNPNLPLAWALSGLARAYRGEAKEGIRQINEGKRLSPFDPHGFLFDSGLAVAHFLAGEYEAAIDLARQCQRMNVTFSAPLRTKLAALGHLGRLDEAAEIRRRLLALEPRSSVEDSLMRVPFLPADKDRYAAGLRLAGLRESAA